MIEQNPQPTYSTETVKPGMVTALGVMTLVSGIINILTGLGDHHGYRVSWAHWASG